MRFDDKFNVIKIYANCFEICFVKLFQEILFCKYISTRNTIHYNINLQNISKFLYTDHSCLMLRNMFSRENILVKSRL